MAGIEIVATFSKSVREDRAVLARLQKPVAIARAVALHTQTRFRAGRTASPPKPYKTKATAGSKHRPSYYISEAYAKAAGVPGKTRWKSSASFHQAAAAKPGIVTGEMIENVGVRNNGRTGALIEFRGSSIGASSEQTAKRRRINSKYDPETGAKNKAVFEERKDEAGNVLLNKNPKKVRNQDKGGRLYKYLRIAALQSKPNEQRAMLDAVATEGARATAAFFGFDAATVFNRGDRVLRDKILRNLGAL